jgi:heat shock protein HtpX
MFIARIIGYAVSQNVREENRHTVQWIVTFILDMALGFLGMIVVFAFSRHREFRADRGGAQYAGKQDMIAALQRLASNSRQYDNQPAIAALKISGGVGRLFATHPPLEERIAALQSAAV